MAYFGVFFGMKHQLGQQKNPNPAFFFSKDWQFPTRRNDMEYLSTCIVDFLLLPMQRGFARINKNLPISNPQMPRRVALQSKCIATNAMEQQLRRRKAAGAPHPILIAITHLSTQRTLVVNTPLQLYWLVFLGANPIRGYMDWDWILTHIHSIYIYILFV